MNAASSIIPFENEEFGTIRTVEQNGRVIFCGKDVAIALGYSNPSKALRDHTRGERIVIPLETSGGIQQVQFITEGDLYRLVASSKLPSALKFEAWVFDEVLPSIRKRGGYMVEVPDETPEQTMARAILIARDTIERQRADIDMLRGRTPSSPRRPRWPTRSSMRTELTRSRRHPVSCANWTAPCRAAACSSSCA